MLGLSLITNLAAGMSGEALTHAAGWRKPRLPVRRRQGIWRICCSIWRAAGPPPFNNCSSFVANYPDFTGLPLLLDMTATPSLPLQQTARLALSCLDLTSLNTDDTSDTIATLCQRAQTPFGPVAAVCVWPRFVAQARRPAPHHQGGGGQFSCRGAGCRFSRC